MQRCQLTSAAFEPGATLPARFTCDGADHSPPLSWTPGPPGTRTYALVMDDPDAPRRTWVHWVLWNVVATELPEGVLVDDVRVKGTTQGVNSWGRRGYGGPCPPSGTHRYEFHLYALDTALVLPFTADAAALRTALYGHVLADGELMGRYARGADGGPGTPPAG